MNEASLHQAEPMSGLAAEVEKLSRLAAEAAGCRDWADFRLRKLAEEMSVSRRITGIVLMEGVLANCMNFFRAESECAVAVLAASTAAGGEVPPQQVVSEQAADEANQPDNDQPSPVDDAVKGDAGDPATAQGASPLHGLFAIPATWPGTGVSPEERDVRRIEMLTSKLELFLAEWRVHSSARSVQAGRDPGAELSIGDIQAVQDHCRAIIFACREEQRLFLSFAAWVNALWNAHTTEQCAALYPGRQAGSSEYGAGGLQAGIQQIGLPGLCLGIGALLGCLAQFLLS